MSWLSKSGSKGVYIVGAKRTGFGAFGGMWKKCTATDLAIESTKAALTDAKVEADWVKSAYFGNVLSTEPYLARHVSLAVGMSETHSTALTINRLCGSGFETVLQGAQHIQLQEDEDLVICGGTESMSRAPYMLQEGRFGIPLGTSPKLKDSLWDGLTDPYIQTPMGMTAENIAQKFKITREECDAYAIQSQQRHKDAVDKHVFDHEWTSVEALDEHARPNTVLEKISKLPPVFQKDGVVTAANASGIADGAGTLVLASAAALEKYNLTPMAKIISYHVSGCQPSIMGMGPVSAIEGCLQHTPDVSLSNVDLVEINEAFAAQVLACQKLLNLPDMNVHGGAIAMGHPLAASGSRIMAHLAHQLQQNSDKHQYALGAACIGGGQGIAILLSQP